MSVAFQTFAHTHKITVQNPEPGNKRRAVMRGASGRTAGGVFFHYDKGVTTTELNLSWKELRDSERDDLEHFFLVHAQGPHVRFIFTDQRGKTWYARFLNQELEFTEVADQTKSATTFVSGGKTYPTSTRQKGVWAVDSQLEVVTSTTS